MFYYDNLMTPLEKQILDTAKNIGYEFELEELREISYDIENSDEYDNLITNAIKKNTLNMGREI